VRLLDNFAKRRWELELGVEPLIPIATLHERVRAWCELTGRSIQIHVVDLQNYGAVETTICEFSPDAIIHFGEQPSAPYSMLDQSRAVFSQVNNISGTLNVLWAMRRYAPDCHLIKLGTSRRGSSRLPTAGARTSCRSRSRRAPSTISLRCTIATTLCSPVACGGCAALILIRG
jgi:nucleoside-diphosphate-sugar epimerase